jgi:hypothetical protein
VAQKSVDNTVIVILIPVHSKANQFVKRYRRVELRIEHGGSRLEQVLYTV